MNLDILYKLGIAELPSAGRYIVSIKISGFWQIVLEKTITKNSKGQNHLPIFFLRNFNISLMSFKMYLDSKNNEIIFEYDNGKIIDRLRKRKDKDEWIGKLYWKGIFLDYFILRRK